MKFALIGRKQGMTQIFTEAGDRIPVTVVTVGPCVVSQLKTPEKDGYAAVQISFEDKKPQRSTKAEVGHFKKAKTTPKRFIREFRCTPEELQQFQVGQVLNAETFQPGDWIDVEGMSKGRGFQGVMKRHHFGGFPATHGTHEMFRSTGSVGMRTWPAKIIKGKRLPGQMGNERVTVQHLRVIEVNAKENAVIIKGALPGHRRAMVVLKSSAKRPAPKRMIGAPAEKVEVTEEATPAT